MAVDLFLEVDGIKGESLDDKHKGAIQILSWSWGLNNTGTFHTGSGGGAGKASFHDLNVTKFVDLSSADLAYSCGSGKHLKSVKLIVRKAGEHPLEYLSYQMEDILVTSIQTGGSHGQDGVTESVAFNFAKVKMEYWTQNSKGGKGDNKNFGWDIAKNAKM